jgi:LysR family glycine cleavage system transcriptional activator
MTLWVNSVHTKDEQNSSMFRKIPSFHGLAAFEAVARYQSFAKAAEELCVTQSAVSHRIKTLEQQFGAKFFIRNRNSVTLTAKGTFFLGAVIESLSTLESACERLSDPRKIVKLSVGPAFARNWLVERLSSFYRLHADIDLEVSAIKLAQANKLSFLKTGEADISIRYGAEADWPGFECIELMRSEVFPVCSPGYKGNVGGISSPKDLRRATLLRLPRQPWKPWFKAAGLDFEEPHQGPLFSDAALMLDAAAQRQGVALARSALVEHDLATGRLVRLFDISIPTEFAYYVICQTATAQREEIASFIDWLAERARHALPGK